MGLNPGWVRWFGLVLGPLLALGAWLWTGAVADPLSPGGRATAALAVLRLIARLGGFLGRKGDGEPGVKTIWLGLQRVMDFAAGIKFAREAHGL